MIRDESPDAAVMVPTPAEPTQRGHGVHFEHAESGGLAEQAEELRSDDRRSDAPDTTNSCSTPPAWECDCRGGGT